MLLVYVLAGSTRSLLHESRIVGGLNLTSPTYNTCKPYVTITFTASDN